MLCFAARHKCRIVFRIINYISSWWHASITVAFSFDSLFFLRFWFLNTYIFCLSFYFYVIECMLTLMWSLHWGARAARSWILSKTIVPRNITSIWYTVPFQLLTVSGTTYLWQNFFAVRMGEQKHGRASLIFFWR